VLRAIGAISANGKETPSGFVFTTAQIVGSLRFRGVRALESPTCWGYGVKNPNKFGTPIRYPRKPPKTQIALVARAVAKRDDGVRSDTARPSCCERR